MDLQSHAHDLRSAQFFQRRPFEDDRDERVSQRRDGGESERRDDDEDEEEKKKEEEEEEEASLRGARAVAGLVSGCHGEWLLAGDADPTAGVGVRTPCPRPLKARALPLPSFRSDS